MSGLFSRHALLFERTRSTRRMCCGTRTVHGTKLMLAGFSLESSGRSADRATAAEHCVIPRPSVHVRPSRLVLDVQRGQIVEAVAPRVEHSTLDGMLLSVRRQLVHDEVVKERCLEVDFQLATAFTARLKRWRVSTECVLCANRGSLQKLRGRPESL